jgi:hypothetical protein
LIRPGSSELKYRSADAEKLRCREDDYLRLDRRS